MLKLLKKKIPKENIHYISLFLKYVSTKNLVVLKKKIESLNIEQADYSQSFQLTTLQSKTVIACRYRVKT